MKNNRKEIENTAPKKIGKRILIISAAVFVSLAVILGAVLGIVSGVKNSRAVVKYNGTTMEYGTVSFFAGYYKKLYMSALSSSGVQDVLDQPAFWNSKPSDSEKTYGELLESGCKNYIAEIIAANYLYDNYATLSADEKEHIKNSVSDILKNSEAAGDKKQFEIMLKMYDFDYRSLEAAAKMLYKAGVLQDIMYGVNGAAIESMSIPNAQELCEEYLQEYTHVKLLIINTETKRDQNGNEISLKPEEREEILSEISKIRGYIANVGTDEAQMNSDMFDSYIIKHSTSNTVRQDGYYFHKNATYTQNFPENYKGVVDKSYEMDMDAYAEVKLENGVCFIYKYAPTQGIYASTIAEYCFTDFYSDLAAKLFGENIALYAEEVVFTDKYSKLDIITLPYNYKYIPRF